ncbi:hypothetical protein JX266_003110 [Neoarthrinium moseri]|nr:hypothetical protein JX266_003110 [Neoarthrinium moseri]
MSPTLEGSTRIVSVLAINLDQLIQNPASQVQVLIAKMFAQNQKDLSSLSGMFWHKAPSITNLLDPIFILIIPGDVGTISDQDIATLWKRQLSAHASCWGAQLTDYLHHTLPLRTWLRVNKAGEVMDVLRPRLQCASAFLLEPFPSADCDYSRLLCCRDTDHEATRVTFCLSALNGKMKSLASSKSGQAGFDLANTP